MLGRPAHIVQLKFDPSPRAFKIPKWIWLIIALPIGGVIIGLIAMMVGLTASFSALKTKTSPTTPLGGVTTPRKGSTQSGSGIATVLMKFGSEGIGPGMFKDARSIALDGAGNIYVGEYSGGRIQMFDSSGKFVTQWSADPKMPLRGLAADRKGNVYVVQKGNVLRFEGSSGKQLGELQYSGGEGFDDITTAPDGGLVCAWYINRDDIVRFDPEGRVMRTIKAAISTASGDSELNTRVAIDGLGNIYALGTFNDAVFKFGPDGKFINRFGGSGEQPGQFRAAYAIAVDGKGRVYVSDIKGVQIFDGDGRYLDVFKPDGGHASGMVFNDQNELFVVDRTKVVKLALSQ
jgi:DNA-binding beta-propeller fold protein YncE